MLVLSRKTQQTVIIDGQVEIEVLEIKGNVVRLGVTAPKTIKILRGELSPVEVEMNMTQVESGGVAPCQLANTIPR